MSEKKTTVLIADDEELICILLQKIILWDELNLEFLGAVHNGQELYAAIVDKQPDIVITDICMPQMSGIDLIGKVREDNIPCRFIIVSGYRQFEYAHNALKYGVEDYILKPVDNDELNSALNKLVRLMHEEGDGVGAEKLHNSEERLKRFFINRIIKDLSPDNADLSYIESEFGIDLIPGLYQSIYIKSDVMGNSDDFSEYADSIQKKIVQVFENLMMPEVHSILFDVEPDRVKIGINYKADKAAVVKEKIDDFMIQIQNIVDLFKDYKVTIGVGRPYPEVWKWKESETEAQYAIESRLVRGLEQVIYWEHEMLSEADRILSQTAEKKFFGEVARVFESLDMEGFEKVIKNFFIKLRTNFSSRDMVRILDTVIDMWLHCEKSLHVGQESEDLLGKQLLFGMRRATSVKELETAFAAPIYRAMEQLVEEVKLQNSKPVRMAIQYLEEYYAKPIKLEDVAGAIGLNPAYFSNIFKRETGENFTDFLMNYRIERAKELLREGHLNINEIACKIGYSDNRYFSKLFKKVVGIKPSDYRKIYG